MALVLVPLFGATLFLASALLFALEPLVAKGLLPVLGGGAAVWTTAVAFFQLALLAGYLYAHLSARWVPAVLGRRAQPLLHVALLAVALLALPLRAPLGWEAPAHGQAPWLFVKLAASIGPAFVLLSATAPLVQRWFASTAHRAAHDPYFLYAASNAGSLVALLAYPILIEPSFGLARQRALWNGGLAGAIALLAACALAAGRYAAEPAEAALEDAETRATPAPGWRERGLWVALSAVPSSLLLSVTTYVTTDLVALPLMWVVPLALYLATFIVAFSPRATAAVGGRPAWLQGMLVIPLVVEMSLTATSSPWVIAPLHLLMFAVTALVCHQRLAASRPAGARAVTEFYLWIAVGGALGGLFDVLAAPLLFRGLTEYPLAICAAVLLRPAGPGAARDRTRDVLLPIAVGVGVVLGVRVAARAEAAWGTQAGLAALIAVLGAGGAATYSFRARPLRFALGLAAVIVGGGASSHGERQLVFAARSFYGIHKVTSAPPAARLLVHGNTLHGAEDLSPGGRHEPLAYYHREGPVGGVMAAWAGSPQRRRVGVVGLGAGALAAYAAPGERWTFFEIDPAVVDISRDRGVFTYLRESPASIDVVLGDARRSLAAVPDGSFGMLVLDAFSSDAVPAHLVTREAFALYLRKLAPTGIIVVHVSNRYLDLEPVIAGAAHASGLVARIRLDEVTAAQARAYKSASDWMVLARDAADLAALAGDKRWIEARTRADADWTDDRSNVWRALRVLRR